MQQTNMIGSSEVTERSELPANVAVNRSQNLPTGGATKYLTSSTPKHKDEPISANQSTH